MLLGAAMAVGVIGANTTVWGKAGDIKFESLEEVIGLQGNPSAVEEYKLNTKSSEQTKSMQQKSEVYQKQFTTLNVANNQETTATSQTGKVQSYGELLKNGDFSAFALESGIAANWQLEQGKEGTVTPVANSKVETGKQQLIILELNESEQVNLVQDVKVIGKQSYSWKAWHTSLNDNVDAYWEAVFLNSQSQIIDRVKLQNSGVNAKAQTGETPENTATVRIQLVVSGARSSNNIVEAKKASFIVLNKESKEPTSYKYTYDANGRLKVVDTGKKKIHYSYDANGNLLRKTVEEFVEPPVQEPETPVVLPNIGAITSGNKYSFYSPNNFAIPMSGVKLVFKGWYLSQKEVEKVQYYAENSILLGESTYGLNDEMTYFNHPEYNNHNAGFKLTVDMGTKFQQLAPGNYKLSVVIKHKDGSSHKLNQTITLQIAK